MTNRCTACDRTVSDKALAICDRCWRAGVRPAPAPAATPAPTAEAPETGYKRATALRPGDLLAITRDRIATVEAADTDPTRPHQTAVTARVPEGNTVTMTLSSGSRVRVVKRPKVSAPAPAAAMTLDVAVFTVGGTFRLVRIGGHSSRYRAAVPARAAEVAAAELAERLGWPTPTARAEEIEATTLHRYRVTVQ